MEKRGERGGVREKRENEKEKKVRTKLNQK
jgi:hypothetical protein